jgi:hypothetical protein
MAKASSLHAEDHGATVWISAGKHASFLDQRLCPLGCGGDACMRVKPLPLRQVINLGEAAAPLSGAAWIASPQWQLRLEIPQWPAPGLADSAVEPALMMRISLLQHMFACVLGSRSGQLHAFVNTISAPH